jgi:hypothetical protein
MYTLFDILLQTMLSVPPRVATIVTTLNAPELQVAPISLLPRIAKTANLEEVGVLVYALSQL